VGVPARDGNRPASTIAEYGGRAVRFMVVGAALPVLPRQV
jgi:hypothetical protein